MNTEPDVLVAVPHASRMLGGISRSMVYVLVHRGELVKVNIGRRGFITRQSIDAYLERLTTTAGEAE